MDKETLAECTRLHGKWLAGEADGRQAWLTGASLDEADLAGVDLRKATLKNCHLRGSSLRGARLAGADFSGADISHADLTEADCRKVVFHAVRLDEAILINADLRRATFLRASLTDAHLAQANLTEAEIVDTDFTGADMRDSIWLQVRLFRSSLASAIHVSTIIGPHGRPPIAGMAADEDLLAALERHESWLDEEDGGERLSLRGRDLRGLKLAKTNLRRASGIPSF